MKSRPGRSPLSRPPEPKPCPRCYWPMKMNDDGKWECRSHGVLDTPEPKPRAPRPRPTITQNPRSRLTLGMVGEATALVEAGASVWGAAGDVWQRFGYGTQQACYIALRKALAERVGSVPP